MSQATPAPPHPRRPPAILLLLLAGLLLAASVFAAGCARDCDVMIERRCRALGPRSEGCMTLRARAAAIPHQSCEAVLHALDQKRAAR